MSELATIPIKEYLERKSIPFQERNGELITKCIFNACDQGGNGRQGHLYFNPKTTQYQCKKCGEQGNIFTLAKHLGDEKEAVISRPAIPNIRQKKHAEDLRALASQCHDRLPDRIRQYLNARGISNEFIEQHQIGWGEFSKARWITLPVYDAEGEIAYFKLRCDPGQETDPKYKFYPAGAKALLFGLDRIRGRNDFMVVCEGEFDCLVLHSQGIPAVTSTAGAGTFKAEWLKHLEGFGKILVCYDRDDAGRKGAGKLIEMLAARFPSTGIYQIDFPASMAEGKDVTDYFIQHGGTKDEFLNILPKHVTGMPPIDASKFKEIGASEILGVLEKTIKKDEENKLATFLCMLSAYTENAQFNISFNAPSSTGKSYIPLEVCKLFPPEDVIKRGHCSPTAFFHDSGVYDKERQAFFIDLSRKILVFMDQPHTQLLERLRPILSHDEKEIIAMITDKTQKYGLRAKKVIIRGYPAVVFCSAGLKIDEQEATRFILLSPQSSQAKFQAGIKEKIKRESDSGKYQNELDKDSERRSIMERLFAIKQAQISNIVIPDINMLEEMFLEGKKILKPRHQRDIGRFISLVKSFSLLNLWFRKRENGSLIANEKDITEAAILWDIISESQEHNLPPYIYELFTDTILPLFNEKNEGKTEENMAGLSRKEIMKRYFERKGQPLADWLFRQEIIPMLENAGLIYQEEDPDNRRKKLIFPMAAQKDMQYSELDQGVNSKTPVAIGSGRVV